MSDLKRVVLYDPDTDADSRVTTGGDIPVTLDGEDIAVNYTVAMDYDGSNNLIYIGYAVSGTAKSAASWLIKKLTYDGSSNLTDIQLEGGNTGFDAVWDNRAALSYS